MNKPFNSEYSNPFNDNPQGVKNGDVVLYAGRQWMVKSIYSGYPYFNESMVLIALVGGTYSTEVSLSAVQLAPMIGQPQPLPTFQPGDVLDITFEYSWHNKTTVKGVIVHIEPCRIGTNAVVFMHFEGDKHPMQLMLSDVRQNTVKFWR